MTDSTSPSTSPPPVIRAGETADPRLATERGLAAVGVASGMLAAIVSSCCLLPIALSMVGVGGSWLAGVAVLATYEDYFLAGAIVAVAAGWAMALRRSRSKCATPEGCRPAIGNKWTVALLSFATLVVTAAALASWFEPVLLRYLFSLRGNP